jgi:hypothetical protein
MEIRLERVGAGLRNGMPHRQGREQRDGGRLRAIEACRDEPASARQQHQRQQVEHEVQPWEVGVGESDEGGQRLVDARQPGL